MAYAVDEAFDLAEDEVKDIRFNATNQLKDHTGTVVDTVASVAWTVDVTGLAITNQFISTDGIYLGARLSTPEKNKAYRVKALATTTAGNKFVGLWYVCGVEKV